MKISGCIVTYNNEDTIEKCIDSILAQSADMDFTLYVSDNNSSDGTVQLVKEKYPNVVLIQNDKNGGFGYGHNNALKLVKSDVHFVINPDIYVDMDVFGPLARYLEANKDVALITPKIKNVDGSEQFLPKRGPSIRYVLISKFPGFKKYRREYTMEERNFDGPTAVDFCTGCFFATRTRWFKKNGGFNKVFYMYFEDADLSRRVLLENKKIVFYPEAYAYHDWNRDNTKSIKGIFRFLSSMCKYFMRWGIKF